MRVREPELLGVESFPSFVTVNGDVSQANPKRFTMGELDDVIARNPRTFVFGQALTESLEIGSEPGQAYIAESEFTPRPEWSEGREDSAYGVYFGELALRLDGTGVEREVVIDIACKHYPLFERDRAVHEYAAMQLFMTEPEIRAFEPLGVWVTDRTEPILLSRFEHSVQSLDNLDWNHGIGEPLKDHLDLIEGLQRSAQILARLHSRGYAHNDAQIKNMAVDVADGSVRLTDLTTLERVYNKDDIDLTHWQEMVYKDLSALVASVRRVGLLRGDSPEEVRRMVDLSLLSIHASMLRHPSTRFLLGKSVNGILEQINEDILSAVD